MINKKSIFIIVLILSYSLIIDASLLVRPTFIFINSPEKSSSITVKNTSDKLLEVNIDFKFGYFTTNPDGNVYLETDETVDQKNTQLLKYIKVFPQNFSLSPEETRTIRLYIDMPSNIEQGEYWARMYLTPKYLEKLETKKGKSAIEIVTIVDIPVNYRVGRVFTGILLENVSEIKELDGKVTFNATFKKSGNAAYWGNINVKLLDKLGKIKGSFKKNISVYKALTIPVEIELDENSENIDKIQIIAEPKRADVESSKLINSKKEVWNIPYKLRD